LGVENTTNKKEAQELPDLISVTAVSSFYSSKGIPSGECLWQVQLAEANSWSNGSSRKKSPVGSLHSPVNYW
jgi:hypothetical protein